MFVLTVKTGLKKPVRTLIILILATVMGLTMYFLFAHPQPTHAYCKGVGEYSLSFSAEADRKAFLKTFGYSGKLVTEDKVRIPVEFNRVYEKYNRLQKQIGLDLDAFRGKTVGRYVYKIGEDMYASVLSYRGQAIGCHRSREIYGSEFLSMVKKDDED